LRKSVMRKTQIILVSATMPKKTQDAAAEIMQNPLLIGLGSIIPKNIRHYYIITDGRKKTERLRALIHGQDIKKALVFVNAPFAIDKTTQRLAHHNIPAASLHAAADKIARKAAITALRNGKIRALISSDAGSRGLDIKDLKFVINLDLPTREKDYLHRAGRCGRAGTPGAVITITTPGEAATLKKMAKKLKIGLEAL